jgi:hypothetical protein
LFSIVIFPSDITGSELNSILTCPRKYEALFVSEITFEKHTEYIKLDLSDNSYSTFEPKIYPPFQYSPLANIESLKFILHYQP